MVTRKRQRLHQIQMNKASKLRSFVIIYCLLNGLKVDVGAVDVPPVKKSANQTHDRTKSGGNATTTTTTTTTTSSSTTTTPSTPTTTQQDDVMKHILRNLSTTADKNSGASSSSSPPWMHDEDATLLDVFGQVAKEVLTNRLIPHTDAICDWNWKHVRCEPYCQCKLQFEWGDYHLGRSCRKRAEQYKSNDEDNDQGGQTNKNNNDNNNKSNQGKDKTNSFLFDGEDCRRPPNHIIVQGVDTCGRFVDFIGTKIKGLNFVIRNRVGLVKDDMCTSFLSDKSTSSLDEQYNFQDSEEFMEKPIRALRRALKCDGDVGNNHHQHQNMEGKSETILKKEGMRLNEHSVSTDIPTHYKNPHPKINETDNFDDEEDDEKEETMKSTFETESGVDDILLRHPKKVV